MLKLRLLGVICFAIYHMYNKNKNKEENSDGLGNSSSTNDFLEKMTSNGNWMEDMWGEKSNSDDSDQDGGTRGSTYYN